jgi:N-acetylated-alpha-linked acidic dipeptidase
MDPNGIYHSVYDDFYHYEKFSDPGFLYGRVLAQTVGTAVVRLADADLLPFEFTNLADTVRTYVTDLENLLKQRQDETRDRNRQIEDGVFAAINDPQHPRPVPAVEVIPPALNFAPLENAAAALSVAGAKYQRASVAASAKLSANPSLAKPINARLIQSERQLTDPDGLPKRPWYRHLLYAPGFYTGYGVKTMPGVRESIEQKQYPDAEREIVRVAKALDRETTLIDAAAADLERIQKP